MIRKIRLQGVLLLMGVLAQASAAAPPLNLPLVPGPITTPPVAYVSDVMLYSGGQVTDGPAMHRLLQELDLLPDGDRPTIVRLQSLRSNWFEVEFEGQRAAWETIVETATALGAPQPIFVAAPMSSEEQRASEGGFFPSTLEELEATGYDWITNLDGFDLRWDREGVIAGTIAHRWTVFGIEQIGGLGMTLCVTGNEIIGWARQMHYTRPGAASLGRFVTECTEGDLELHTDRTLPADLLARHGLDGGPFALMLPRYSYNYVTETVLLATRSLGASRVDIPVRFIATGTLDEDEMTFVPTEEHAELLLELGFEVDVALSEELPEWVDGFGARTGTVLLFDENGELLGSFFASVLPSNNDETLNQALLRLGLF